MKIKTVLVVSFLTLFAVACGTNDDGRGNGIEECGGEGTNIVADFDDPQGAENPAYLAEFNDNQRGNDRVYAAESSGFKNADPADQVGEIACLSEDGTIVLTGVGNQIRSNLAGN